MTSGLHHVTLITRRVQDNVDFYAGFLGLRLVKQTAGFEDARQLHLFYGDGAGSPGSLVSFLVWEDGSRGRVGHGQVAEIALAIPKASVGDWLTRALGRQIPVEGPLRAFGADDHISHALTGYAAVLGDLRQRQILIVVEIEQLALPLREDVAVKIEQHGHAVGLVFHGNLPLL